MALGILPKGVLTGTLDHVTKYRPCLNPQAVTGGHDLVGGPGLLIWINRCTVAQLHIVASLHYFFVVEHQHSISVNFRSPAAVMENGTDLSNPVFHLPPLPPRHLFASL